MTNNYINNLINNLKQCTKFIEENIFDASLRPFPLKLCKTLYPCYKEHFVGKDSLDEYEFNIIYNNVFSRCQKTIFTAMETKNIMEGVDNGK